MYKMVVLDLDQTLLKNDKSISEYSIKVLKEYSNFGKIVIATGRSIVRSKEYADLINAEILITLNGSIVYDHDIVISNIPIAKEIIIEMVGSLLNIKNLYLSIFYPTKILTNNMEFVKEGDCIYSDFSRLETKEIQKIFAFTDNEELFSKINFERYHCKTLLDTHNPQCHIIMNEDVNKLFSINRICYKYGFSLDDVIAFGDDYNDLEMIKECGLGIAVENANDFIKNNAKIICKSNEEDGPAKWIEENLLNPNPEEI